MYVRREAVLSSQIEDPQSAMEDLLEREMGAGSDDDHSDVGDVVNYLQTMNSGSNVRGRCLFDDSPALGEESAPSEVTEAAA